MPSKNKSRVAQMQAVQKHPPAANDRTVSICCRELSRAALVRK